jgi:hypothetical protein
MFGIDLVVHHIFYNAQHQNHKNPLWNHKTHFTIDGKNYNLFPNTLENLW